MNKAKGMFTLAVIVILGSLAVFFGTNLVLSDVSNMFYMTITIDVLSSLPMFIAAIEFVAAAIGAARYIACPEYQKRLFTHYGRILFVLSILGMASTIAAYEIVYGELKAPYPFKFAGLVILLFHLLCWYAGDQAIWRVKKKKDDASRKKITVLYVIYNVFLGLLVFYAFNRFGGFLLSPTFIQVSTLGKTWPLYLSLILPMALLINAFGVRTGMNKEKAKISLIYSLVILAAGVLCFAYVMLVGMKDPLYISSVSPVMPIERLLTKPIDTVLLFSVIIVFSLYSVINALLWQRKLNK